MGTIFISICLMPASGSHFIWILGKREKSIRHKLFQTPKCEFNFPFTSTLSFLLINFFEEWVCYSGQKRSSPAPPCLPPCIRAPPPPSRFCGRSLSTLWLGRDHTCVQHPEFVDHTLERDTGQGFLSLSQPYHKCLFREVLMGLFSILHNE